MERQAFSELEDGESKWREHARGKKSMGISHNLHYFSKLSTFDRVESFNCWSLDFL
jgi:hypothetical protein